MLQVVIENDIPMPEIKKGKKGRHSFFKSKKSTIETIKKWHDGKVNYLMQRQLIERGFVQKVGKTSTTKIEESGRGRHKFVYELTPEGRKLFGQYGISRNWKS